MWQFFEHKNMYECPITGIIETPYFMRPKIILNGL